MEQELFNQNALSPNDNPLAKDATPTTGETKKSPQSFNLRHFTLPKDPKVLALSGMVLLLLVLLITAGIVSFARSFRRPNIGSQTPTPTPAQETTPTPASTAIPSVFQSSFSQIDKEINLSPDLNPPLIDTEIGK